MAIIIKINEKSTNKCLKKRFLLRFIYWFWWKSTIIQQSSTITLAVKKFKITIAQLMCKHLTLIISKNVSHRNNVGGKAGIPLTSMNR